MSEFLTVSSDVTVASPDVTMLDAHVLDAWGHIKFKVAQDDIQICCKLACSFSFAVFIIRVISWIPSGSVFLAFAYINLEHGLVGSECDSCCRRACVELDG